MALVIGAGEALGDAGRLLSEAEKSELGIPLVAGELIFVPRDGTAFAAEPVRAAPRFVPERPGCAVLPASVAGRDDLTIAQACGALVAFVDAHMVAPVEDQEPAPALPAGDLLEALRGELEPEDADHIPPA